MLLPTFQSERFVSNAIESVLEQTLVDEAELIVVDDGSTDATRALLRRYESPGVRVFEQANAGTAAARNRALALARGEVVVLLDHDDELHPRFLERVGAELDRESRPAVVSTDAYLFDEQRSRLLEQTFLQLWPLPATLDLVQLIRGNFVPPRAAIRRDVLLALGGFDERVSGADDYALWLSALAAGHAVSVVREPLFFYRMRAEGQGNDRIAMAARTLQALEHAQRELPLDGAAAHELAVRVGAWRERLELARAGAAIEERRPRAALRHFLAAWRSSPLRWRPARIAFFAGEGLLRLGRGRQASPAAPVGVLRRLPRPQGGKHAGRVRALRRSLGTHPRPRRAPGG